MDSTTLLRYLHVLSNLVWIGSILSVVVALVAGRDTPETAGKIARAIYLRVSSPAFGISFVTALTLLFMHWKLYMVVTHWMHAKLMAALAVIAIHHVIGARARGLATGKRKDPGPVGILGACCSSPPQEPRSWPWRSRFDSLVANRNFPAIPGLS
jgi:putative membrane protein